MEREEEAAYHRSRAAAELDLGLTATSLPAARAHIMLSSLHMQQARSLAGAAERCGPNPASADCLPIH